MIEELGKEKIPPIFQYMESLQDNISRINYIKIPVNASTSYVKYTSKSTMYSMLESDSLYLFCSELSNDRTENKLLNFEKPQDAYITCFYHNNSKYSPNLIDASDIYSQWMSYCREGGAAFEFYFGQDILGQTHLEKEDNYDIILKKHPNLFDYSLVCANAKSSSDYFKYSTFPFRVQYFDNAIFAEEGGQYGSINPNINSFALQLKRLGKSLDIDLEYVAPYFKHSGFVQECEARLAVVNYNNQLSQCIHFMNKKDGTKIPYINAKFGDIDNINRPCVFPGIDISDNNAHKNLKEYIENIPAYRRNRKYPIIIPQGRNQEKIYNIIEDIVENLENKGEGKFCIICQGHLPITKITLAPTPDRQEQRKMMEIFCKSKYWLRRVQICESTIPYNTQNNNHV